MLIHAMHDYLIVLMGNPYLLIPCFAAATYRLTRAAVGAMERLER